MDGSKCNQLIMEIGSLILISDDFSDRSWSGIAVVANCAEGCQEMTGYSYAPDRSPKPAVPEVSVLRKLKLLREEMGKEKGQYWHQCLIHITKPDMKINIQFEYDDPDRWSLKKVSLDMKDYADSLKPPM